MFETKLKCFQSNWGGDYRPLQPFLLSNGIEFRHHCPYTHQQNGMPERKHRHIIETGLTLLAHASMPLCFWWAAFDTVVYLINRLPTPSLSHKSPFEMVHKRKPNISSLKVFSSACFLYLRAYNSQKFDFHSSKCLFLGYSNAHKGYKYLHSSGRIYISRNVAFNEQDFPFPYLFHCHSSATHTPSSCSLPISFLKQLHAAPIVLPSVTLLSQPSFLTNSTPHSSASLSAPGLTKSASSIPAILPISFIPVNSHPMLTRAKCGIFKTKAYTLTSNVSSVSNQGTAYCSISKALCQARCG
ncbi:hypothetical protein ACOSQ2_021339 [Xanthoceras sorbifolium]